LAVGGLMFKLSIEKLMNKSTAVASNIKKYGQKGVSLSTNIISGIDIPAKLAHLGMKGIKSFIDNNFREKVIPTEGSVIYSDLYFGVEHSGIYIGENKISNIVVDGFAQSTVKISSPASFTDKSMLHKKIYVSCNAKGAVGGADVSSGAKKHLGERGFYGLVFNNCHEFSEKCVNYSKEDHKLSDLLKIGDIDETWENSIKSLKRTSKNKIGATKWKLWDWEKIQSEEKDGELKVAEIEIFWKNIPLDEETIKLIKHELFQCNDYNKEISDENLPKEALSLLDNFKNVMQSIDGKYEEIKGFIKITGCGYSYNQIMEVGEDFLPLIKEMENNKKIQKVIKKLGKDYVSEEKKLRPKVMKRMNNEIMGIHKSNDLVRLLPSELVNFESEYLEYLFYSRYLENSLLTYEIVSRSEEYNLKQKEKFTEIENKKKGPVIACLDTSGSMFGLPILRAKALLLLASKILEKEKRSLYVILFGGAEEIKELNINSNYENDKLISFLNSGFGGGTDFETPITRGIEIIKEHKDYNKADILMITDGLCNLSNEFQKKLKQKKIEMDFSIYTIICNDTNLEDEFSDEVIEI
jgi:uncharacterized protein with von Willebrand factor type A (vWA) domain